MIIKRVSQLVPGDIVVDPVDGDVVVLTSQKYVSKTGLRRRYRVLTMRSNSGLLVQKTLPSSTTIDVRPKEAQP